MKKIGFIGYGQMNSMLARGFLSSGALTPGQVIVATRTGEKVSELLTTWPGIRLAGSNQELAAAADVIIIGVRPLDLFSVLSEIHQIKGGDAHIISIAGCIRADLIASAHPGRITRILPSVCSTVQAGISLCYHHPGVSSEEAAFIEDLFGTISRVITVEENLFEPAGDLMSCGPALITKMFMEFAAAGSRHSSLSYEEAFEMVLGTALGTALLLHDGVKPDDLISRVATPGGITEEGIKILEHDLPTLFDWLFATTLAKHQQVRERVRACRNSR
ncbi:MAG TPA: pyrroline-5-carboxylate reductase dimerization domain-containing protein [Methanospirillum sp.]|nr:pyrroline-5-carboxylate reductase dimerization domain-containing protein [Methanospirillum sp.]